jgi:salicylate hydroxylase
MRFSESEIKPIVVLIKFWPALKASALPPASINPPHAIPAKTWQTGAVNKSPLIIVGGGIAGLAATLALGQRDVVILEQAKVFSELGAGLQLGPNAVRALQKLGAWDAVEPFTSSPPEIHLRDGLSGKILKRLTLGKAFEHRFGAPYRVAHRADLHNALLSVVKTKTNIQIRLGETVSSIENQDGGVIVLSNGKTLTAPAAIAADGVNSPVRQHLFAGSAALNSGSTFHRALLETPHVETVNFDCVNVWFYPNGHVVHYQVGKNQKLNLIAITPGSTRPSEHFSRAATPLTTLLKAVEPELTKWPGLYVPKLPTWVKGNVLLLGDAAHATLPYLAQGAAMALEDAACLSKLLEVKLLSQETFEAFHQRRVPRTERLHQASCAAGITYHHHGFMRLARNTALLFVPDRALLSKLSWVYNH